MKAVIYARYSSDNQREESIEGQLRECTAYCKKNNITILRTYIDRAMSATSRVWQDKLWYCSQTTIKIRAVRLRDDKSQFCG